jgi:hypothetical protein
MQRIQGYRARQVAFSPTTDQGRPLPIRSPTISKFVRSKAGLPSVFELGAAGAGPTRHRSWDRPRGVCRPRTTRKTCIRRNRFSLRWNLGVDQRRSTRNSDAVEACHSPVDATAGYRACRPPSTPQRTCEGRNRTSTHSDWKCCSRNETAGSRQGREVLEIPSVSQSSSAAR